MADDLDVLDLGLVGVRALGWPNIIILHSLAFESSKWSSLGLVGREWMIGNVLEKQ